MDSSARLDYILFQLTPTRTRCDLVIFAGKSNEKLAYGLLEPFIAHLKSAKDQISKGGYSITLRPPTSIAPWFTKATLQRFVRFVSTPEVLERFVTIEREINQLENSIKSYEASIADDALGTETEGNASKQKPGDGSDSHEENSKARLQRVVETRKAVLRKEQAMVYARALAAGFEIDNLDDLLLFSDAFGASRLREACVSFKDLCKKKNEDRHWVDEIAAMQAIVQPDLSYLGTSGIILAGEDDPSHNFMMGGKQNASTDVSLSDSITSHGSSDANQDNGLPASAQTLSTDANGQVPNPWANQFPPYLRNFQGPMYQQMPPYQGYFPGMQAGPPPYYPANMQWASDRELHDRRDRKSASRKKGRSTKTRSSENEEQDESTESNGSSSGSETDSSSERSRKKKHGKKSSRKVVIRNINYITSKRDGEKNAASEVDSSDEDDYLNGDALKQQLEDAVGSFENHQKSSSRRQRKQHGSKHQDDVSLKDDGKKGNENWDAFQQLLLKDEPESNGPEPTSVKIDGEIFASKQSGEQNAYAFQPEAEGRAVQRPIASVAFLVTQKGSGTDGNTGEFSAENFEASESSHTAMKRGGAPEEFLFSERGGKPEFFSRLTLSDEAARSSIIRSQTSDDWFVANKATNGGENNHLRFIDGDYVTSSADQDEKKRKDAIVDDSLMIHSRLIDDHFESQPRTDISFVADMVEASLVKNSVAEVPQKKSEPAGFCEPDDLYMVLDRDTVEDQVPSWTPEIDFENNVSVVKRHSDVDANADSNMAPEEKGLNKKSVSSANKTSAKDTRSRTSGGPMRRGKPDPAVANRRSTFGSKTTSSKSQLQKEEERRKRMEELLIQRQKRIAERSATSKSQSGSKSSVEEAKKPKPVLRSSTIERLAAAKTSPKAPAAQPKKEASKGKGPAVNNGSQKTAGTDAKKPNASKAKPSEKKSGVENVNELISAISEPEAKGTDKAGASAKSKELPAVTTYHTIDEVEDSKDIKELHITSSNPIEVHADKLNSVKDSNVGISEVSPVFPEDRKIYDNHEKIDDLNVHPLPESPIKPVAADSVIEKTTTNGNFPGSPEFSEIEESTPPISNEMSPDSVQLRKKWDSAENSPKSTKGFRKLLMFGRKN